MALTAVQARAMYNTRPTAVVVTTAPTKEPIAATVAKLHCRIDLTTDDTLMTGLIASARFYAEQYTGRCLMNQTITAWYDMVPPSGAPLLLTRGPVTALTSISTFDADNTESTFAAASYLLDSVSEPSRVVLNDGYEWPDDLRDVNAVKVVYTAGYGNTEDSSVPAPIRQAMLLLIAYLYENREAGMLEPGLTTAILPLVGVMDLLAPYRLAWM